MTKLQQAKYDIMLLQYGAHRDLTPGVQALIYTLACVESEEFELQEFCDLNGTCYAITNNFGITYSKMRPEWQQLKEARMRKMAIIAKLENWIGEGEPKEDELSEFLT